MKSLWYRVALPFLYIVGALCVTDIVYGEETTPAGENPLSFSYQVIQPENQRNNVGYFDLRMTPGQKQTVQIELRNNTAEEKTIEVSINGTTTNSNGVIENGPSTIENDASLIHAFEDLVSGPESVKLPAKATATVELTIQMPSEVYDGVISGGIQLKEVVDEKERAKQVGVINEYSLLVGMLLTETDAEVLPELTLNTIYVASNGGQTLVYANISNTQAAYVGALTIQASITQAGNAAVLYEVNKSGLQMGPNNQMDFPLTQTDSQLVAGDYEAHITAVSGERSWSWDQAFTITKEDLESKNQSLSGSGNKGINWLLVASVAGIVLLVGLGIFFVVRKMNETQTRRSNHSSKTQRRVKSRTGQKKNPKRERMR